MFTIIWEFVINLLETSLFVIAANAKCARRSNNDSILKHLSFLTGKSILITLVEICICITITILHILLGPIINDSDLMGNYRKYKITGLAIIIVESVLILVFNFYDIRIHSCLFFSLVSAVILHYAERVKRGIWH